MKDSLIEYYEEEESAVIEYKNEFHKELIEEFLEQYEDEFNRFCNEEYNKYVDELRLKHI